MIETDQGLRQCQEPTDIREMAEVEWIGLGSDGKEAPREWGNTDWQVYNVEWLSAVTEVQEMNRHQPFSDNCYTRNNVFRGRERSIANVASKRHRLILVTKKNLWLSKWTSRVHSGYINRTNRKYQMEVDCLVSIYIRKIIFTLCLSISLSSKS